MKRAAEQMERRKHRRYIVRGRTRFLIDSNEVSADLVNFGQGGLLIRTPFAVPVGTRLDLRILAFCYPAAVHGVGEVVGGRGDLLAIQFVESSPEADQLLRWLEVEHCPWTGTCEEPGAESHTGELHPVGSRQAARTAEAEPEAGEKARVRRIEEEIFQQA